MTCTEARELLSLRRDGIAVPDTLDSHLAVCPSCRNYERLLSAALARDDITAPDTLTENVMSRLEKKPSPLALHRRRAMRVWLPVTAAACAVLVISIAPAFLPKAGSAAPRSDMQADCAEPEYFYGAAAETCEEEMPMPLIEEAAMEDTAGDGTYMEYRALVTGTIPEDIPWEEQEDGGCMAYLTAAELRELEKAGVTVLCEVPLSEIPDDALVETAWERE